MKITTKLWIGIIMLIILSPLGLILPERFRAAGAWGEWGTEEMRRLAGYVPKGLGRLSSLWNSPIPDYVFKGWERKGLPHLSFAYIISAIVGISITAAAALVIGRILAKKDD